MHHIVALSLSHSLFSLPGYKSEESIHTDTLSVANPELSPNSLTPKTQCQEDSRRLVNVFPLPQ